LYVVWFQRVAPVLPTTSVFEFRSSQPIPIHIFTAMRPTIARQSDMPGRKCYYKLLVVLNMELMEILLPAKVYVSSFYDLTERDEH
jgi:hypothetical protein